MGLPKLSVEHMLHKVSLTDTEADRRVRNYSLGMRQRLGIATALIGDPEVLILDEPANGLDPAGIRWMRDLLREYANKGGTVLLSSHLLHEIEVIADDIVVIGNGRSSPRAPSPSCSMPPEPSSAPRLQPIWRAPCSPHGITSTSTSDGADPYRRGTRPGRQGRTRGRRRPDRAQVGRQRPASRKCSSSSPQRPSEKE